MEAFRAGINVLGQIVIAIGGGLGIWGIINLLEGYGSDNPGAKSQGIKQLMGGGGLILLGIKVVPLLANLFG
ncbi:Maff2 family mobile element protein [Helcococcus bovis]|uniref:Maff2 family mobile element protein n=1 Tax=Helcococcus bovis TaxID=3153252 RepID=UPI0038B8F3C6